MKILVLGGAGYIGSHTVYELIDAGEEVVIIDNLETGHIEAVHPKAKFYKGDLRDKAFCRQCTRSGKRYRCSHSFRSKLLSWRKYGKSIKIL